jgi:hypothetical protein
MNGLFIRAKLNAIQQRADAFGCLLNTLNHMANIIFKAEVADANKGFRPGKPGSLFVDGVTFTIKGFKLGRYENSQQKEDSQAILFETSIGEDINANRLLSNKRVCFDADGKAQIIWASTFHKEFTQHLNQLERRKDDPSYVKGSAEDCAKHLMEFFNGKTIKVVEVTDVYFKDKEGRLVAPFSPVVVFTFD